MGIHRHLMDDNPNYDSSDDSEHTITVRPQQSLFLFPPGRSSSNASSTSSTPTPSRSTSPLPQFYPSAASSSSGPSDSESEPNSPLLREYARNSWLGQHNRRPWWAVSTSSSRHRRRKGWRMNRTLKRHLRELVRHPFFPSQPITIVLTLILFVAFAICLTLLLIYILNPDKEPLPWRAYCSVPSLAPPFDHPAPSNYPTIYPNITDGQLAPVFPPPDLEDLPPAGVFVGVFSIDSAFERRELVRTTFAAHPRSRDGAGLGDDGNGTSRTIVRFVMGQPRRDWERRVRLEMEKFNDIIILPIAENMNDGKSYTFFSWAAINAWVPPVYTKSIVPPPRFSYSNSTSAPPPLAPHDPYLAYSDINSGKPPQPWVRPDYVVKVDDDAFIMLAELEARLRVELHTATQSQKNSAPNAASQTFSPLDTTTTKDPLIYWGYLVTNRLHVFMAGELYALSWSLVDWVSKDPTVKTLTRGAEDKQTSKWMRIHPRASEVRWTSERCWIYDHPRSGTVYAHGYLFPSEVTRVRRTLVADLEKTKQAQQRQKQDMASGTSPQSSLPVAGIVGGAVAAWAHSSVSTFHTRYTPPLPDLSTKHSVEALVEGSDMSLLREGSPMSPNYAWTHREGRRARYEAKRVGGTVVVHFIKKNMWYLETAIALLEGEEQSESEKYEEGRRAGSEGAHADSDVSGSGGSTSEVAGAAVSHVQARTRKILHRRLI